MKFYKVLVNDVVVPEEAKLVMTYPQVDLMKSVIRYCEASDHPESGLVIKSISHQAVQPLGPFTVDAGVVLGVLSGWDPEEGSVEEVEVVLEMPPPPKPAEAEAKPVLPKLGA